VAGRPGGFAGARPCRRHRPAGGATPARRRREPASQGAKPACRPRLAAPWWTTTRGAPAGTPPRAPALPTPHPERPQTPTPGWPHPPTPRQPNAHGHTHGRSAPAPASTLAPGDGWPSRREPH
jgi:hypothetical protein